MGLQQLVNTLHNGASEDWGVLQDFSNAFNRIRRDSMLDTARERCRELVTWLETCYAEHLSLFSCFRSWTVVQQGHPCGPVAFALTM